MADRNFIIELLLKARDDTARAFAEATGNMEAYNALLDEQKRKQVETAAASDAAAAKIAKNNKNQQASSEQLAKALKDVKLRSEENIDSAVRLQRAQDNLTKSEAQGKKGTLEHAASIKARNEAEKALIKSLAQHSNLQGAAAKGVTERIRREAELTARLREQAAIEERLSKAARTSARATGDPEKQRAANLEIERLRASYTALHGDIQRFADIQREAFNVEHIEKYRAAEEQAEANRIRGLKILEAMEKDIDAGRVRRARENDQELSRIEQRADDRERSRKLAKDRALGILTRAQGPAQTLARTDISQTQEIQADRKLTIARNDLADAGLTAQQAEDALHQIRIQALQDVGFQTQAERDAARVEKDHASALKEVSDATREYESLSRKANQAQTALDTRHGVRAGQPVSRQRSIKEKLEINVAEARARLEEFRKAEGYKKIHQDVKVDIESKQPTTGDKPSVAGGLDQIKKQFAELDTSTSGFQSKIRGALAFSLVGLIQPVAVLLVGLVGTFGALASAAIAAGAAIGATFVSGMAQAMPVVGLFAAAMARLKAVFGLVSAQIQQQQQAFIQQFQIQQQNAIGLNQVTQAEHSYHNALFAVTRAIQGVGVAQYNLWLARRDAIRQIQDLIFQEQAAKLAAEGSALSVVQAQKALRQAVATGGDVAAAQLGLQSATLQHQQAVVQVTRAHQDAQLALKQGVEGAPSVIAANRALVDSRRAVTEAQFQVVQTRAYVKQAILEAQGYNVGIAAQLAYLRSQMTSTELALAKNITNIVNLFRGAHGRLRPVTDAILGAFVPLTAKLYQLFQDPKFFGALLNLGRQIGAAIRTVGNTLTSSAAIHGFIALINAAAANMKPLAAIASGFFRGFGQIAQVAIPFVHQLMNYFGQIAKEFGAWASSTSGKNWLKDFFDVAFRSLKAFIGLAGSIGRLVLDIVGVGGGAKTGIGLLKDLQNWVDRTSKSIENHHGAFHKLQQLWATARPTLHALGEVLKAVVDGFLKLAGTDQGRKSLQGVADLLAHVLIPAFVQFAINIGKVATAITGYLSKHPQLQKSLKDIIAIALTFSFASRAIGLIFGPLASIIGLIKNFGDLIKKLPAIIDGLKVALAAAFANPIVLAIAAVVAAIIAISVATGNLGNLMKAVASPFILFWNNMKPMLKDLAKAFVQLGDVIGLNFRNGHKNVKVFLDILGFLFRTIAMGLIVPMRILTRIFITGIKTITDLIKGVKDIFSGVFDIISGIVTLNGSKIIHGFVKIGRGIFEGLKGAFLFIPRLLIGLFKDMVDAVLKWLGIASPSRRMHTLGEDMVKGIWNGLKSIAGFAGKLIGWIASGIGKLIDWVLGLGGRILKGIWDGLVSGFKKYWNFEKWLWGHIFDAIWGILKDIEKLGEKIVDAIIKGIKKAPGKVAHAISSIIPDPVKNVIKDVGGALPWNWGNKGGVVGSGYGGGDRRPYMLEDGEHILTKGEVRAAGGHGAVFALRRALGGGTQGGPRGYAQGGTIGPMGATNTQIRPATTQGVHGQLGGQLLEILNFGKNFNIDWLNMWTAIGKQTLTGIVNVENNFNKLLKSLKNTWQNINQDSKDGLQKLTDNFSKTLTKLDNSVFNALWYVQHAANQSLKAFGAKPVDVTLGAIPKLAGGGVVGKLGERGRDAVHAVLGRGEAVLNWGHQKLVEPALNAYYGFGLNKMFERTRGAHAGARGYMEGLRGYAAGGYVYPFGPGLTLGRTDQGLDMGGSGYIATVGDARFTRVSPQGGGTGWPGAGGAGTGALIVYQLTNGPAAGRFIYLGENVDPVGNISPGKRVKAGTAFAHARGAYPFLEMGWAIDPQGTAAAAYHAANYPSHSNTPEGIAFTRFIQGLSHGKLTGLGGAIGGSVGAAWNNIKEIAVHGKGQLAELAKKVIKKVTKAANTYGGKQAGQSGGLGVFGGNLTGPVEHQVYQFFKAAGFTKIAIAGMLGNAMQESGMNPSTPGGGLWQMISTYGSGAPPLIKQMTDLLHQLRTNPSYGLAALQSARTPAEAAQIFEQKFERAGIPAMANRISAANAAYAAGYAQGGFTPDTAGARSGTRVPIIAHAGEWILNKAQQMKLAARAKMSVESLKKLLGFTGGPISFAGGGEVRDMLLGGASTPVNPYGAVSDKGVYKAPNISYETPGFTAHEIGLYEQAQRVTSRIVAKNSKQLAAKIKQFLANYNIVGGDNGIFALAAQAIQDFTTRQQTAVQLAAAGVRLINQKLVHGQAQGIVAAARTDLASTERILNSLETLQKEEAKAFKSINNQIKGLGPHAQRDHAKQYEQLVGARQDLLKKIQDTDSQIAQGISDRYNKTAALADAQFQHAIRTPTLLVNVGQLGQRLAQTLGNPSKLAQAGQWVMAGLQQQQDAIRSAYESAAKKAKKDPRWQKTADDLQQQLQDSIGTIAEAQAQALTDAMAAVDVRATIRQSFVDFFNRMAAVRAGFGDNFGAIQQQIAVSQANTVGLQGQIGDVTRLRDQAAAQGNVQAMNDLSQKILDLTAQVAEANLQTQQLITSYRQLAVTIMQQQTSATSGFFSAANQIAQTLGAIAGNQNLAALIAYAKQAGSDLLNQAQQILKNVSDTINDPNNPFGANQSQASQYLQQLTAAFQQGPQAFANMLAQMGPNLGAFEATLPPDQQTLFQNLVQSMIDNTTAQVDNTQQLQQLNATTNQQQFTSSAWQMFRDAIFNGLGQLLPQYAMTVPAMDVGGRIMRSGLLYGHKDEEIIPANVAKGESVGGRNYGNTHHWHITNPTEVADPVALANAAAWRLNHDPNSR